MKAANASDPASVRWVAVWDGPVGGMFRLGREGANLVAQWEGLGTLRASRDGSHHEVTVAEGLPDALCEKLCSGHVRALLRHLAGGMTLHGSAVAFQEGAIVFLGANGAGKSTAAADACRRLGGVLLADDLVSIDEDGGTYRVTRTDAAHWLLPDARAAMGLSSGPAGVKAPVSAGATPDWLGSVGVPVRALVVLSFDDAVSSPSLTALRGRDAFDALHGGYVRFIVDEPEVALRDFDCISSLSAAVPTLRLTRRRRLGDMASVAQVLLSFLICSGGWTDEALSGNTGGIP